MSIEDELRLLTDLFTGSDGGVGFFKLREFLVQLERQAEAGDVGAGDLLEVVRRFRRLCDIAGKR